MLRRKWSMGKKTIYIPPSQRKMARFQNINTLIEWGRKIQKIWNKIPDDIQKDLSWFEENKENFEELKIIDELITFVKKEFKKNGYSLKTSINIKQY